MITYLKEYGTEASPIMLPGTVTGTSQDTHVDRVSQEEPIKIF